MHSWPMHNDDLSSRTSALQPYWIMSKCHQRSQQLRNLRKSVPRGIDMHSWPMHDGHAGVQVHERAAFRTDPPSDDTARRDCGKQLR
jgi:hypothetical protein